MKTREEAAQEGSLLADENAADARRRAWAGTTKQGTYRLEAELDPVSGARLATALQAFTHLDDASVPEAERRSPAQRRADGLIAMATAALDSGTAATDHGICPHVSVLMDADTLAARDPGGSKSLPTSGRRREGFHPCQAHHVQWENGGPTSVDNGVLLCSHHRCVHEGGWRLSFDPATGVVAVTSPDGTIVRTSDPPGFNLTLSDTRPPG